MRLRILTRVAVPTLTLALIAAFFAGGVFVDSSDSSASAGDETTYYFLTDHLGSVDVVLDDAGNVVERRDYLPYGSERLTDPASDSTQTAHRFTGKELDDETGLYYYSARYYDAEIGRFVSVDPAQGDLKNPQSLNRYSYVLNNPVKYVDPTGKVQKTASLLSKIVNVLTYGNLGKDDGWLAQSAKNYSDNPNDQAQTDLISKQSEAISRLISNPVGYTDETWDSVTTQRIGTLDPKVQIPATDFINEVEENEDTTLRITDAYRSNADQDGKYAQGRDGNPGPIITYAKGGESYHNYGLAIDVAEMKDGSTTGNTISEDIAYFATGLGFEWGGSWTKFHDYGHFQMTFGQSISNLQEGKDED